MKTFTKEECAAIVKSYLETFIENDEFVAAYDRLRGTNLMLNRHELINQIDLTTGKFEEDAEEFFRFCLDQLPRIDPPA